MKLTVNQSNDLIVITVDETRLDAAIATRFKDRMREIVTKAQHPVLIDMRGVDFMDSSGLGAMIAVHKAMPADVGLTLDGLTPNVDRVFRLTRMDSVFTITDSTPLQEKRA
ncbi:MAG: STAS domain-containing protein [Paracoccus sp. (in: a-proteobacteria)]|uniref:STAS domain-containing protein n=1 Tax=Paracoccus sp. TaxID=267 RepID=UPI0026E06788|nr:STAS domain-containing protein [Paracoccus sp. (in: a-proteobacteria)]MDO5611960.1 STAS domain-containing protein [Paracoccus sp. (in: a-proteobacteria)]